MTSWLFGHERFLHILLSSYNQYPSKKLDTVALKDTRSNIWIQGNGLKQKTCRTRNLQRKSMQQGMIGLTKLKCNWKQAECASWRSSGQWNSSNLIISDENWFEHLLLESSFNSKSSSRKSHDFPKTPGSKVEVVNYQYCINEWEENMVSLSGIAHISAYNELQQVFRGAIILSYLIHKQVMHRNSRVAQNESKAQENT